MVLVGLSHFEYLIIAFKVFNRGKKVQFCILFSVQFSNKLTGRVRYGGTKQLETHLKVPGINFTPGNYTFPASGSSFQAA